MGQNLALAFTGAARRTGAFISRHRGVVVAAVAVAASSSAHAAGSTLVAYDAIDPPTGMSIGQGAQELMKQYFNPALAATVLIAGIGLPFVYVWKMFRSLKG